MAWPKDVGRNSIPWGDRPASNKREQIRNRATPNSSKPRPIPTTPTCLQWHHMREGWTGIQVGRILKRKIKEWGLWRRSEGRAGLATYHSSGRSVCRPLQSYTFNTASQNLPHEGMLVAPPADGENKKEIEFIIRLAFFIR